MPRYICPATASSKSAFESEIRMISLATKILKIFINILNKLGAPNKFFKCNIRSVQQLVTG